MKIDTLILDGRTVRRMVDINDAIKAVEKSFWYFGKGRTQMPPKLYIHLDKYKGDFRAMPSYIDGMKGCIIKWVSVHAKNRKKGLPTVMALIVLSDASNGLPLCIMDGTYATALRTGAAGAVAVKYLARKDSHKIAMIGCGVQARTQLSAIKQVMPLRQLSAWDINKSAAKKFIKDSGRGGYSKLTACDSVRECVEDADIVVTTTPSRKPIVKAGWIKAGTHINAIGADAKGKQELDPKILKKAKIVVDAWGQASHSGEINVPFSRGQIGRKDVYADMGEIVVKKKKARTCTDEITVFDSTGLAIQDAAIANLIYLKALKLKAGKRVNLGEHE